MEPLLGVQVEVYVLGAAAVGVAAMGIVEGAKSTKLPPPGFRTLMRALDGLRDGLAQAYGPRYGELLKAQFRSQRAQSMLPKTLRQGVRIGLTAATAPAMAQFVGMVDAGELKAAATAVQSGKKLTDQQRNVIGRFELVADARIDGAMSLAEQAYQNGIRFYASIVAIGLSLLTAVTIPDPLTMQKLIAAFIIGIVAVPIAPIAKDIAKGIRAAGQVLGGRK